MRTLFIGVGLCFYGYGCGTSQQAQPQVSMPSAQSESIQAKPQAIPKVEGNPFDGAEFFIPPYSNADQARRRLERSNPEEAALIAKIADTPQAKWLGEWSGDIRTVTENYVRAAHRKSKVALLVAYNVPGRDCGQHSAGGAVHGAGYRAWIEGLTQGISDGRRAVVVLEPDALPQLEQCLSVEQQALRLELLAFAVDKLSALPGVSVYLDAGHSRWVGVEKMAERLEKAGVHRARGFALNTSNYIGDQEILAYGQALSERLGGSHFIVDSSRNGNGPTDDAQWCNPAGRALGRRPAVAAPGSTLDAFAWLKSPGESDGECGGGPKAGQWFHEQALELARNAKW